MSKQKTFAYPKPPLISTPFLWLLLISFQILWIHLCFHPILAYYEFKHSSLWMTLEVLDLIKTAQRMICVLHHIGRLMSLLSLIIMLTGGLLRRNLQKDIPTNASFCHFWDTDTMIGLSCMTRDYWEGIPSSICITRRTVPGKLWSRRETIF